MPTSTSFKQECPSCEALVPIRDPKLIGKKIECPKCKFKFVVKEPPEQEEDEKEEGVTDKAAKKPKKGENGKVTDKKPAKPGAKKGKDADKEESPDVKKKKKKGNNTLLVGGGLAVGAVAALGYGAYALFSGPSKPKQPKIPPGSQVTPGNPGNPGTPGDDKKGDGKDKNGTPKGDKGNLVELTNLLPADATAVYAVNIENLRTSAMWRAAVQTKGAFNEESVSPSPFEKKLGFSLHPGVERVVTATSRKPDWVFSVVRTAQKIDQDELIKRLGLVEPTDVNGQKYYLIQRQFDSVGNLLFKANRPRDRYAACFVDDKTLIFADVDPLKKFLQDRPKPAGSEEKKSSSSGSYSTLAEDLKTLLEKVEQGSTPPLVCVVGDLDSVWTVARPLMGSVVRHIAQQLSPVLAKSSSMPPFAVEGFDKQVKEAGNNPAAVLNLADKFLPEEVKNAAVALTVLADKKAAVSVAVELKNDQTAETWNNSPVKRFIDWWTNATMTTGTGTPMPGPMGMPMGSGGEGSKKDTPFTLAPISGKVLSATYTADLKEVDYKKYTEDLGRAMIQARALADLANTAPRYHQLAKALTQYRTKTGHFPRGTAARRDTDFRAPQNRVSWMAEIVPFLPDSSVNATVDSEREWFAGSNLSVAKTVVPQFVVRGKDTAFRSTYPGLDDEFGVTHFVGMAGLGPDIATYQADDKSVADRLGIFGYDRVTKVVDAASDNPSEISKERLGKVIALIQVPPDYRSPWLAGGGATVRGVSDDEKSCVQPFVCTEYKSAKADKPERGTFAIMGDGKVRFIRANIEPALFRSMCVIKAPAQKDVLDMLEKFNDLVPEVPDEDVAVQVLPGKADKEEEGKTPAEKKDKTPDKTPDKTGDKTPPDKDKTPPMPMGPGKVPPPMPMGMPTAPMPMGPMNPVKGPPMPMKPDGAKPNGQ
jgi:hypothetical protein